MQCTFMEICANRKAQIELVQMHKSKEPENFCLLTVQMSPFPVCNRIVPCSTEVTVQTKKERHLEYIKQEEKNHQPSSLQPHEAVPAPTESEGTQLKSIIEVSIAIL